ncbi:hypothetical protein HDE_04252 [Halotydeus destructor]|nr:hypothetical protein HDE_04252 [Halotydeus destructor]
MRSLRSAELKDDSSYTTLGGPEASTFTVLTVGFDKSISARDICERLSKTINFMNTASLRQNLTVKLAIDDILHALKTKNMNLRIDKDLIDVVMYLYMHNEWNESMTSVASMPQRPGFSKLLTAYNSKATAMFHNVTTVRSKLLSRLFDQSSATAFDEHKDSCYAFIAFHYKDGFINLDLPQEGMTPCFKYVQCLLFLENDNSKLKDILGNPVYREIALFLVGTLHFSFGPNDTVEKATAFLEVFNGGVLKRHTNETSVPTVLRKARLVVQLEVYKQDEAKLEKFLETQPESLKPVIDEFLELKTLKTN